MSIDGYIDGATESRLLLSNELDFDRVDEVRAGVDAILVGATTVRNDNPRLLVRDEDRRRARLDHGLPEHPVKVTVTQRGRLDTSHRFFADDGTDKLVYASSRVAGDLTRRLGSVSDIVDAGDPVRMTEVTTDLHARGVRRLMVEGGGAVHTQFLADDLVDETSVRPIADEIGLGRSRVLSLDGRDSAAQRWYDGSQGPDSEHAQAAPAPCRTCGFLVPIAGPLSTVFGVCANESAPDDGRVVAFDHGCGAHSETASSRSPRATELPPPVFDTLAADELTVF